MNSYLYDKKFTFILAGSIKVIHTRLFMATRYLCFNMDLFYSQHFML